MRNPTVWVQGFGIPKDLGGSTAEVALGHAARAVKDFAIALDVFEEDALSLERALKTQTALMDATRKEVVVQTEAGPDIRVYHDLPENFDEEGRYWERRQLLHARAAVLSLDQLRRALSDFSKCSSLPSARAAIDRFDVALPGLRPLRNSVSHANHRATGKVPTRELPRGGPIRHTDLLSNLGYCDGGEFVMRVAEGPTDVARIAITEATLALVLACVQVLASSIPWQHTRAQREPLRAPLAG